MKPITIREYQAWLRAGQEKRWEATSAPHPVDHNWQALTLKSMSVRLFFDFKQKTVKVVNVWQVSLWDQRSRKLTGDAAVEAAIGEYNFPDIVRLDQADNLGFHPDLRPFDTITVSRDDLGSFRVI